MFNGKHLWPLFMARDQAVLVLGGGGGGGAGAGGGGGGRLHWDTAARTSDSVNLRS
jgi:hypothetical protein